MFGIEKAAFGLAKHLVQPPQLVVKHVQHYSCIPPTRQVNANQNMKNLTNTRVLKSPPPLRYSSTSDTEDLDKYRKKEAIIFDLCKVQIEKRGPAEESEVLKLIYKHHFSREPSVINLKMPHDNPYLAYLANRYTKATDRWVAFLTDPRTLQRRVIGVMAAFLKYPDEIDKLYTLAAKSGPPARYLIDFQAQCLDTVNFFKKYNVPYIYDIELMATTLDVPGNKIKDMLLWYALSHAKLQSYPLVQVASTTYFMSLVCARGAMVHEWRKNYEDFATKDGKKYFTPLARDKAVDMYTMVRKPADLGFPKNYQHKPSHKYQIKCFKPVELKEPWQ